LKVKKKGSWLKTLAICLAVVAGLGLFVGLFGVSEDEKTTEEPKIATSVFTEEFYSGVTVSSLLDLNKSNSAFVYEDLTLFENSTVKKITLPIRSLADYSIDQVFTLYVVDVATVETTTTAIKTIPLIIKANTYTSNTVNAFVDFELDLKLEKGQTLAFSKNDDTITIGYRNSSHISGATIFNKVLTGNIPNHYGEGVRFYVDVYTVKN